MIFGWSFQHSLLKKKFQSIDWQKNDTIIRVLSMHDLKMHFIFHHLQVQRLHSWVQSKVDFQISIAAHGKTRSVTQNSAKAKCVRLAYITAQVIEKLSTNVINADTSVPSTYSVTSHFDNQTSKSIEAQRQKNGLRPREHTICINLLLLERHFGKHKWICLVFELFFWHLFIRH